MLDPKVLAEYTLNKPKRDMELEKERRELAKPIQGKIDIEAAIQSMASKYDALKEMGAIQNKDNGALMNLADAIAASRSAEGSWNPLPRGQDIARMFNMPAQPIRDSIYADRSNFANLIKTASGMSAKQFDSNSELQNFLQGLGSPEVSYETNQDILARLSKQYGTGEYAKQIGGSALANYTQRGQQDSAQSVSSRPDITPEKAREILRQRGVLK